MYTLRKITSDGVETNFELGKNYSLITRKNSENKFKELFEQIYNDKLYLSERELTGNIELDRGEFFIHVRNAYENNYNLIYSKNSLFNIISRNSVEDSENKVFAFIESDVIYPIYKNELNFIMTDSGKTFSNLTYK